MVRRHGMFDGSGARHSGDSVASAQAGLAVLEISAADARADFVARRRMNNPPRIRAAEPREAATLSELALRAKAHWGYSAAFIEACRAELSLAPAQISSAGFHCAVAESRGRVVGFYGLERRSETVFESAALFVEPRHIGAGVGRALLEHAKRRAAAAGAREMIIQGDPHAESFYRAAGGRRTGVRESGSVPGRQLPLFTITLDDGSAAGFSSPPAP